MQYILTENNDQKTQFKYVKKQIFGFGASGEEIWIKLKQKFEFYLLHIHRENLIPGISFIYWKTQFDIFSFPEVIISFCSLDLLRVDIYYRIYRKGWEDQIIAFGFGDLSMNHLVVLYFCLIFSIYLLLFWLTLVITAHISASLWHIKTLHSLNQYCLNT